MEVNAYIGVIGSGKTFQAEKECDKIISFADALREDMWKILGWKPKTFGEYEAFKSAKFSYSDSNNKAVGELQFTGRELLQNYGTEVRRAENKNHWASKLQDTIIKLYMEFDYDSIGITDIRFSNEIKKLLWIKKTFGFIKINFIHCNYKSDKYDYSSHHKSEELAQSFLDFKGTNEEFTKLIIETYGH